MAAPSLVIVGKFSSGKGTYAKAFKDAYKTELDTEAHLTMTSSNIVADVARRYFGAKDEEDGKPNRTLMQEIGKAMIGIRPSVFADYIINHVNEGLFPFITEGMRSQVELDAFRNAFHFPELVIVKIQAHDAQRREIYKKKYGHYPTEQQLHHPTEMEIDGMTADITFINNYSTEELDSDVKRFTAAVRNGTLADLLKS